MDERKKIEQLLWLPDLLDLVNQELSKLSENQHDQRPALEQELKVINDSIKGWSESLAKPDLSTELRTAIESDYGAALERRKSIENTLTEWDANCEQAHQLVDESEILRRLERLADVLAANNPTMGNLHLSLHIDRIQCGADGTVAMRTCKLGTLTEAVADFADQDDVGIDTNNSAKNRKTKSTPRRRGRLRVEIDDDDGMDLRAMAEFAADVNRFTGLNEDWFWTDNFQVPDQPPTWVAANSERVFRRRQEAKLSHAKLAAEFGVSKPTIRDAIKYYLITNPDAKDEVNLPSGGARPIKFHLETFADEARKLWEDGWSKLKLADKYGCSSPTIDKALVFAYEQAGLPMPTREDQKKMMVAAVRRLHDNGLSLDEIAAQLQISDVTARRYLRASFESDGEKMPDLRKRRWKP